MGIFNRDKHSAGGPSQPEGDGPVTLDERNEPGGEGSPDTNQGKTEPMSPTPDHPEPAADIPDLGSMSVGSGDPQSPSHPAAGGALKTLHTDPTPPKDLSGPGQDVDETRPGVDDETSTGREGGPSTPLAGASGESHRAPGSLGTTPDGEAVETDVQAGADRMAPQGPGARVPLSDGHGDPGTSPAAGDSALEGSSEEHAQVTGIRMPDVS